MELKNAMRWVSLPIQDSPWKTLLLLVVVTATAVGVYLNTASEAWALFSVFILMVAVHDYVLPTTYRFTDDRVSSRILFLRRSKSWSGLRSYWVDANGVLLSPFPKRSLLEAHRGLYIRFAGADREAVVAFVERKICRQSFQATEN